MSENSQTNAQKYRPQETIKNLKEAFNKTAVENQRRP